MPRKRGKLSPEDVELWRQVARTTTPLHRDAPKPAATRSAPPKRANGTAAPDLRIGSKAPPPHPVRLDLSKDAMHVARSQPLQMDKKKHQRMQRGKLKPDARIDLHGMTLAQAHSVLTGVLLRAHAHGDRLVLVITGKGREPDIHHGAVSAHKGVLRQAVPRWLSLAPLAQIVLQLSPASQRHGGEGAYYVYLKRPRGD